MNDTKTPRLVHLGKVDVIVPNDVWKLIKISDRWLVLFGITGLPTAILRRNLWCFDDDGQLLWKIQAAPYLEKVADAWNGIWPKSGRVLLTTTGDDRNFFILDMATGQIKFMSGQPVPDEPDRDPGR